MKRLDVIRRPKTCPYCGGDICDIICGMPVSTWEEDHLKETGHKAVLGGCCITGNDPDYQCEDCGRQFRRLSFPNNAKQLAKEALLKDDDHIFCDVSYFGLYRKMMVFEPVARQGICWDGIILIFVDQKGQVKVRYGIDLVPIIQKIQEDKRKLEAHNENFYWYAAKRLIKDEEYYETVHKCGMYHGKRAYQPIFKEEYRKEPPKIGLPLVILVDSKGRAEYIRDFLSFDIYNELRKKSKKHRPI